MKRWDKDSKLRITERLSLRGFFCFVLLLLFFLQSYIPHLSMYLEKSRRVKRSVDDLELFDDQRRKSARII